MQIIIGVLLFSVMSVSTTRATEFGCPKPMAVPDAWNDVNGNGTYDPGTDIYDPDLTGYNSTHIGEALSLHLGSPIQPITAGNYVPVDFPAINRGNPISGADQFQLWLTTCSPFLLFSADTLLFEPGPLS